MSTRLFGAAKAVEGLTLSVPEGAVFGLLGPNGAGKTSTIRMMIGHLHPSSGSVRTLGQDPWQHAEADPAANRLRLGKHGTSRLDDAGDGHAFLPAALPRLGRPFGRKPASCLRARPAAAVLRTLQRSETIAVPSAGLVPERRRSWCWTNRPPGSTSWPAAAFSIASWRSLAPADALW